MIPHGALFIAHSHITYFQMVGGVGDGKTHIDSGLESMWHITVSAERMVGRTLRCPVVCGVARRC